MIKFEEACYSCLGDGFEALGSGLKCSLCEGKGLIRADPAWTAIQAKLSGLRYWEEDWERWVFKHDQV